MIPYRVSVFVPNGHDRGPCEIKLYGTFAGSDDEALRAVSESMPDGWRVDRIVGLLSRFEVERLRLARGEVREVSSLAEDDRFLPEEALYAPGAADPHPLH